MGFFNRIRADPGFVNPVRSDPGFVSPIRSGPIQLLSMAPCRGLGHFKYVIHMYKYVYLYSVAVI